MLEQACILVERDDHGVGGVVVDGLMDGMIKRKAMGEEVDFLVGIKCGDGTCLLLMSWEILIIP